MLKKKFRYYPSIAHIKPVGGWCVDASTIITNSGPSEYRCIDIKTKEIIFSTKIGFASNNMAEFLALMQALILSDSLKVSTTIFIDSWIAIAWFKNKRCYSRITLDDRTRDVYELIAECIDWLKKNKHRKLNTVILWQTRQWGQIPADYNRK